MKFNPPRGFWEDVIRPLDDSEYDLQFYVSQLQRINYNGKVFLHTFAIERAPEDHLQESIRIWEELVDNVNTLSFTDNIMAKTTIYPNPFRAIITINVRSLPSNSEAYFEVYNELGQMVYEKRNLSQDQLSVNLERLPKGVYLAKIGSNLSENTSKILKF